MCPTLNLAVNGVPDPYAKAEQRSELEAALLAAAFAAMRDAMIIIDATGQVLMLNSSCRQLLDLDNSSCSMMVSELLCMVDETTREPLFFDVAKLGDPEWLHTLSEKALLIRRSGSEFPFEMTVNALNIERSAGWTLIIKDLFIMRSLVDTVHFQRSHDQLTGLSNRSEFERHLQEVLLRARAGGEPGAMAYIDIDQFKVINDTCGHVAGDELLRQLTDLLRFHLEPHEELARIGGDEFGLLMPNIDLLQAKLRCEILRRQVEDYPFNWSDKNFSVSISVGLVQLSGDGHNWASAMGQADAACSLAKEGGRNQVCVFTNDDNQIAQRQTEMNWVSRIVQALRDDRFQLFAQPIVATADGHICHQEILIRMIDVDGSIIPPAAFLPAAERFNLVLMVDKWVLSRTLHWLSLQLALGRKPIKCAVNLSGASIGQKQFHDFVAEELRRKQIPGNLLCFEVTETAAINNLQTARQFISQLKSLGVEFAIDDFGAGMASFAYLKNLSADYLKIDGVFVREMHRDFIDYAMVKSINEVGHVMNIKTIAEFVENDEILQKLKEIGVDFAQGYGVGMPTVLKFS